MFLFCLFSQIEALFPGYSSILGTDNVAQRANCKLEQEEGRETPALGLDSGRAGSKPRPAMYLLGDHGPITGPQFLPL